MFRRRGLFFLEKIFLIFVFFTFLIGFISALSVTPAKISLNFEPNFEQTFSYEIFGTKPDKIYSLYLEGNLAQYATLSREELEGDGNFKVSLELPSTLETPGDNKLYVGVKESIDEELAGGTIGTAVEIKALISVYVPYPGKYVEISFEAEDANIGEPIDFKLNIFSRGKEDVLLHPRIEISSNESGEIVHTLYFDERALQSMQEVSLHKVWDTSSFNAGRYNGVAFVEYGGKFPSRVEDFFRLGELAIEIKNYTSRVIIDGKIQKFDIEVESSWNDPISGVYAEVVFLNGASEVLRFKTSSTSLNPWEAKTITGYFDTINFEPGFYNANITLFYYGKNTGKTFAKEVQVEFVKKPFNKTMIIGIGLGIISLVAGLLVFFLRKKSSRKK